ncbi:MAG: DNA replication/repair protein RecF [bacterium]
MQIKELTLESFRNYEHQSFVFDPYINVLIGRNAQGKTNVLEAIALLASTRSFKTHIHEEMIMFDHEFASIKGQIITNNKPMDMRIVLSKLGKRAFINQKDIGKTSDYIGYLNVILFLPEDLQLIKGGPKLRRQLIDQELSKISPIYMYNLQKYQNLLKERNKYLKMLHDEHRKADPYLEVLSEQMAHLQVDLILRRQAFVSLLDEISHTLYDYINAKENLHVSYRTHYKEISYETIMEKYQKNYQRDILYNKTMDGLHRDDLKITLNDQDATLYASQGQQRSIVLALKIALLEIVRKEIGEYPVLLLDDVLSELDDIRKMKLLNLISDKVQTFVTTTTIDGLHHRVIDAAKILTIENGKLKEDAHGRNESHT